MTQTQKHLLKLFSEIDKICKENDIDYYIAGGSTIGAVRHEGFIPWDDDFDIMMTRKNFLKFVDYCKDNLPDDRILECQELNRNYHNMFARYTDKTMTTLHQPQLYHKDNAGFVIDILPLDPLPNNNEAYKDYLKNLMLYSDLLNCCTIYSFRYNLNAKEYIKSKIKMLFLGKDKVLSKLEQKLFCHDEDSATHFAMRWGGVPLLFEKKMYDGKRYVDFFGMKGQVPYRMSDYLVQHYGDNWFMLPPNQEQQTHDAIFSTEIDEATIRKFLNKNLNLKFSRFALTIRKCLYFLLMNTQTKIKVNRRFLKARAIEFDINKDLNEKKQLILSLDKQKDYNKLQEIFSEYFSMQLSRTFIGREDFGGIEVFLNPLLFKIDDEIFEIAIKTLINKNGMASALRLMDVYEQHGYTLSENLKYYKELLLLFRSLVSRKDVGEDISDKHRIKEVIDTFPCAEMFINFALELYQDDEQQFDKILEYAIEHAPKEDLVVKAQLDRKELDYQTLSSYITLYDSSSNGLLRLSIKKILENKSAIILDILNKSKNMKEATYLSYKMARITPNTKEYIEFYLRFAQSEFTTLKEQRAVYITLENYYQEFCSQDLLKKHFVQTIINVYSKIFDNEYLAECLPFVLNDESLHKTAERAKNIEQILKTTSSQTTKAWCNLFLIDCYKKIGRIDKLFELYTIVLKQIGFSPLFDALLSLRIKNDAESILELYKNLKKKSFFVKKYKKLYSKELSDQELITAKTECYQSIVDKVSKCIQTPKHAFDILNSLQLFDEELFDLHTLNSFDNTQRDVILAAWDSTILICLCKSAIIQKGSDCSILDELHQSEKNKIVNDTKVLQQDETAENEQFEDIPSRAVTLLSEIDKICKSNNIEYALYNSTINRLKKEILPVSKIKIIMNIEDFDRFVKLMTKDTPPNRSFECLKTNPKYQGFSAKYFDLNSTRINLLDPYSNVDTGICIEIIPVCPYFENRKDDLKILETEVLNYTFKDIITSVKFLKLFLRCKIKSCLVNKQKRANEQFDALVKRFSNKKSEKYFIKEYGLASLVVKGNPMDKLLEFNVKGIDVKLPSNISKYLTKIKRLAKTNVYKNENKSLNRVVSQSCKREDFLSLYKSQIDEYSKHAKKHLNLQRFVTILNRKRRRNWNKANNIAHEFIMEQEIQRFNPEKEFNFDDYLENLKDSNAKATLLYKC